jgi:hypothetical protein
MTTLSRLSLAASLTVAPILALAAPATTPSELFDRLNGDGSARSFVMDATMGTPTGDVHISIDGASKGLDLDAMGHAKLTLEKEGSDAGTLEVRMAWMHGKVYIRPTVATGEAAEVFETFDDLSRVPWMHVDVASMAGDAYPVQQLMAQDFNLADMKLLQNAMIDAGLVLTHEVKGGTTTYRITMADQPLRAFLLAATKAMPSLLLSEGLTSDDLREALREVREMDTWLMRSLSTDMMAIETAKGIESLTLDLAIVDDMWDIDAQVTAESRLTDEILELLPPLGSVDLMTWTVQPSEDDWSDENWENETHEWEMAKPTYAPEGTSPSAYEPNWPEGCSLMDMRRGTCWDGNASPRWGQR